MTDESAMSVVEDVHETATSLEDQAAELEQFRDELDTMIGQVEGMRERERSAFYENAESISADLDTFESVEAILDLEETLKDLIRSPLREAALSELDSFLDAVRVELSSDTDEEVRNKVGDSIPQDLDASIQSYQELTAKVETFPEFLKDRIQHEIEDRPSTLTDPEGQLRDLVLQLERRQDALIQLDELIQEAGNWIPEATLSDKPALYQDLNSILATGKAKKQFDDIEERIDEIESNGLEITELVKVELERGLGDVEPDSLLDAFNSVSGELHSLNIAYEPVAEWASDLEAFGTNQGVYESEIDELLAEHQKLHNREFDSVKALRQRCQKLKEEMSSFIEAVAEQLNVKRNMVKDVIEEFEDVSSPDIDFEPDNTGRVTQESVRSDLNGGLNAILELDDWFEKAFSELGESFDSEDAFDIWKQLYDGDSVDLTEENEDTILALANRFSIRVELGRE